MIKSAKEIPVRKAAFEYSISSYRNNKKPQNAWYDGVLGLNFGGGHGI
jgi:hypothetical protein